MKFYKSIKFKIFFLIATTFSLIIGINFTYELQRAKEELNSYLNNLNQSSARLINKNIKDKLYTLDYTQTKEVIDSFDNIYFEDIYVLNENGYIFVQKKEDKVILKRYENFDNLINLKHKNDFIYFSKIEFVDKHLGYLVIHNNHQKFLQVKKTRINELIKILLILVLVVLLLSSLLSFIITRPINRIIKRLQNTDETKILAINYIENDEFGYLSSIIENKHNKIKNINENLEKRIEKKITQNRNMQEKLFKSEKLASMGEMIGNIAHQWRQPLSVISLGATGIKFEKELGILEDEMFYKTCDRINNNAQYLSKTIDDFKNFVKGDRIKTLFSLTKSINSFIHLTEGTIKNNDISMVLNLDDEIKINGYENELIQCFINIFNNSKDALNEKKIENRFIFISSFLENQKVIIKIRDNAFGIPDNIISHIFEPYFTTRHQSQGTGLGLHMTYNLIVDGMNGEIEASNIDFEYIENQYTGAEFTITLPIC